MEVQEKLKSFQQMQAQEQKILDQLREENRCLREENTTLRDEVFALKHGKTFEDA